MQKDNIPVQIELQLDEAFAYLTEEEITNAIEFWKQTGHETTEEEKAGLLICDEDDLKIYVKRVWISSGETTLTLGVDNATERTREYRLYSPRVYESEKSWDGDDGWDGWGRIATMNAAPSCVSTERIGIETGNFTDEFSVSFDIVSDATNFSVFHHCTLSCKVPEDVSTSSGWLIDLNDLSMEVEVEGLEGAPILSEQIDLPENAEQYRRLITLNLQDNHYGIDPGQIQEVQAMIVQKITDDPEYLEERENPEAFLLGNRAFVDMTEQEPGVYQGEFSGLIPLVNGVYTNGLLRKEGEQAGDQVTLPGFSTVTLSGDIRYFPDADLILPNIYLLADFNIDYVNNEAEVANVSVRRGIEGDEFDVTGWPVGRFATYESGAGAAEYYFDENGAVKNQEMGAVWVLYDERVEMNGESLNISLVPVEDYDPDMQILYVVILKDGTRILPKLEAY